MWGGGAKGASSLEPESAELGDRTSSGSFHPFLGALSTARFSSVISNLGGQHPRSHMLSCASSTGLRFKAARLEPVHGTLKTGFVVPQSQQYCADVTM